MHCHHTDALDLDAPNVGSLLYMGFLEKFPFSSTPSSPPTHLQHAQLSFRTTRCCYRDREPSTETPRHALLFWEPIGIFSRLVVSKVKLVDINDIAVHSEQEQVFLKVFPNLKFLQLEGSYESDSYSTSARRWRLETFSAAAQYCRNSTSCLRTTETYMATCHSHGLGSPSGGKASSSVGPGKIHGITSEA